MGGMLRVSWRCRNPEMVRRIATLGTKYVWNPEIAAREVGYLDPEKIAAKVPQFAQALAGRHTALGWETVVRPHRCDAPNPGRDGWPDPRRTFPAYSFLFASSWATVITRWASLKRRRYIASYRWRA
jgi:hypothetical protein